MWELIARTQSLLPTIEILTRPVHPARATSSTMTLLTLSTNCKLRTDDKHWEQIISQANARKMGTRSNKSMAVCQTLVEPFEVCDDEEETCLGWGSNPYYEYIYKTEEETLKKDASLSIIQTSTFSSPWPQSDRPYWKTMHLSQSSPPPIPNNTSIQSHPPQSIPVTLPM